MTTRYSAFIQAVANDDALPIDKQAAQLWLKDLHNPGRWILRPLLQFFFGVLLHLIWFVKRLPLPQFRAHSLLQRLICWFCKHWVTYEANILILRHFATESNILNFLNDNDVDPGEPIKLYPTKISDMLRDSFVEHDQELFRLVGGFESAQGPKKTEPLRWTNWQPIENIEFEVTRKRTQIIDFETAHVLFMCLFCLLLTRDEYRDAINGFQLDQSIAIRVGKLIDDPSVVEYAYNKYPHYLVGPWNLTHRFFMHGLFTEYLYARLALAHEAQTPKP
ncbi:DUF6999 family protein [Reinekea blandensis]|uniref:Uncharacterized protein n=1 Tax=Reinekea blandensis MED297 TaxID=314283 RepID=A4BB91_9GAMM|nr:hypothetical protein [Reinekea blandensis]EAR10704.1 hypothetical protein MED297_11830 [Reinekea sp. MED297] [Reinekea blandensis MED297]